MWFVGMRSTGSLHIREMQRELSLEFTGTDYSIKNNVRNSVHYIEVDVNIPGFSQDAVIGYLARQGYSPCKEPI